jgi:hypothetical protein
MGAFLVNNWGILVTIVGFVVTILTLLRAKTAAVAARQAAEMTKAQLSRVNTITEFSSAIADRYSALRRLLETARANEPRRRFESSEIQSHSN